MSHLLLLRRNSFPQFDFLDGRQRIHSRSDITDERTVTSRKPTFVHDWITHDLSPKLEHVYRS